MQAEELRHVGWVSLSRVDPEATTRSILKVGRPVRLLVVSRGNGPSRSLSCISEALPWRKSNQLGQISENQGLRDEVADFSVEKQPA